MKNDRKKSTTNTVPLPSTEQNPIFPIPSIHEESATLAFYGIDGSARSAKYFYKATIECLSKVNLVPTFGTIRRKEKSTKWLQYRSLDRKLTKEGFKNVTSIELSSMLPDTDDPIRYYYLYAMWRYNKKTNKSYASITVRSAVQKQLEWNRLAEILVDLLKPRYGIYFRRPEKDGPIFFVTGIGVGGPHATNNERESRRTNSWMEGMDERVYLHGMIRDVFEWNFLNELQLDQLIGNLTLKEWIESSPEHGTLTPASKDLTIWEVDMRHQPSIFRTLFDADIIYDQDRHMYWFQEGRKLEPAERIAIKQKGRKEEYDRLIKEWGPEKTDKWLDERGY